MSEKTDLVDSHKDENGKNKHSIYCRFCPCKILNTGVGTYVSIEQTLPHIAYKKDGIIPEDIVRDYWAVDKVMDFENIGVSNQIDNIKYLACADCDRGPVGWHDKTTQKSYIALPRVKHQK